VSAGAVFVRFCSIVARSRNDLLAGLCRDKSLIVLTRVRNDLHAVLESAIQSVGKSGGETHCQKIDIELQVPLRIQAVNH